jgi:hypothetical protein
VVVQEIWRYSVCLAEGGGAWGEAVHTEEEFTFWKWTNEHARCTVRGVDRTVQPHSNKTCTSVWLRQPVPELIQFFFKQFPSLLSLMLVWPRYLLVIVLCMCVCCVCVCVCLLATNELSFRRLSACTGLYNHRWTFHHQGNHKLCLKELRWTGERRNFSLGHILGRINSSESSGCCMRHPI